MIIEFERVSNDGPVTVNMDHVVSVTPNGERTTIVTVDANYVVLTPYRTVISWWSTGRGVEYHDAR